MSQFPSGVPEEYIDFILDQVPLPSLLEISLVSREWQLMVDSHQVRRNRAEFLLFVSNQMRIVSVIHRDNLVQRGTQGLRLIGAQPHLIPREFQHLEFPVRAIVGSSQGLVCFLDRIWRPVVINPRTLSMHVVDVDPVHGRSYAIGWILHGASRVRCSVIVRCPSTGSMTRMHMYNLTTLQWSTHNTIGETAASVTRWESGAFVCGTFLWLGRLNSSEAVILYQGSDHTVSAIHLTPSMRRIELSIGNIGDGIAAVWPRFGGRTCFWIINIADRCFSHIIVRHFAVPNLLPNPLFPISDVVDLGGGSQFLPLLFIRGPCEDSNVLFLRRVDRDVHIGLYNIASRRTYSLQTADAPEQLISQTQLQMVVSFTATLHSPWSGTV